MKLFSGLFLLLLAVLRVAAESELAHAMEMIYMFSKYQIERAVYPSGYWLAPSCRPPGKGACTFNEFVSYIKRGTITGAPEIIELNGKFDWTNHATVQKVATKLSTMPLDPAKPQVLYMAGEMSVNRVYPKVHTFTALYNSMKDFDKQVKTDIDAMTDVAAKARAQNMLLLSNNQLLKSSHDLRTYTRRQKLRNELTKKFSPKGKFDSVYQYTDENGKTQRFDPIQWVEEKGTLWGRSFTVINMDETEKKNPQMLNDILKGRVQDHIALFNSDGSDGKGAGLMEYDPQYAGTNGRHEAVIKLQKEVGVSFQGVCRGA
ncbi:hypothetical protein SBRCBS47491_005201 [Sporothrix bragantina]|uniref:Uncharacterized protein n=1 Tax=Sporothrix bragantina TaxID=671064 RepID=A0ABP0BWH0_9PEZI